MANEHHAEQNRGWFFPIRLVRLYQSGHINAEQMMLLGLINSFTRSAGCFASNTYLAEKWGKTIRHTRRSLELFAELGLLKERQLADGRRTLHVQFMGDLPAAELRPKCPKERDQNVPHSITRSSERNGKHVPLTGDASFFGEDGEVSPFVKTACHKLEDFIRTSRQLNGAKFSRARWYEQMRLLLQDIEGDKSRLKRVLVLYLSTPHTKFTPQVFSARCFRKKFLQIETWVNEQEPPPAVPTIRVCYSAEEYNAA